LTTPLAPLCNATTHHPLLLCPHRSHCCAVHALTHPLIHLLH
jgi:hypothetical protein